MRRSRISRMSITFRGSAPGANLSGGGEGALGGVTGVFVTPGGAGCGFWAKLASSGARARPALSSTAGFVASSRSGSSSNIATGAQ
jgi:hypothetical protein